MLGITCALYDEAAQLIRLLTRQKTGSIYHYSGTIDGVEVSLFLTKPALHKNKNNFINWLRVCNITSLLQTGYCGALSNRYRPGDVCAIDTVSLAVIENNTGKRQTWLKQTGQNETFKISPMKIQDQQAMDSHNLLTVDHPVFTLDEQEDLRHDYKADLLDMEAWHICSLLKSNTPEIKTHIVKIAGDVPGEEKLMTHEIRMRSFFSERNKINRLQIAFHTGLPFFELYFRKRMLQRTLKKLVLNYIYAYKPDLLKHG